MEDAYEKDIENEWGPANAITHYQIRQMFKMAKLNKNDVFYDLGSGHGRVVRLAVKESHVKKAIGIEHVSDRFCHARMLAKKLLTKPQLAKVDFLLKDVDDATLGNATIAYNGFDPSIGEPRMYRQLFKKRRVRIIRKDLPTVGYAPDATSHDSATTWFFLMSYPLRNKIRDRNTWAKSFLGPEATIDDVYR